MPPWLSTIEIQILHEVRDVVIPKVKELHEQIEKDDRRLRRLEQKIDQILDYLAPPPVVAFRVTTTIR